MNGDICVTQNIYGLVASGKNAVQFEFTFIIPKRDIPDAIELQTLANV